jgi:hypothetical protein
MMARFLDRMVSDWSHQGMPAKIFFLIAMQSLKTEIRDRLMTAFWLDADPLDLTCGCPLCDSRSDIRAENHERHFRVVFCLSQLYYLTGSY